MHTPTESIYIHKCFTLNDAIKLARVNLRIALAIFDLVFSKVLERLKGCPEETKINAHVNDLIKIHHLAIDHND